MCWGDWVYAVLGCLFFRGKSQKDKTRSVDEQSCGTGPEHEASTSAAPALEMTLLVGPNFQSTGFQGSQGRLRHFLCLTADLVLPSTATTCHHEQYTRRSGASLSIEPRRRIPRSPSCGQSSGRGHASAHQIKRRRDISHFSTNTTAITCLCLTRSCRHTPRRMSKSVFPAGPNLRSDSACVCILRSACKVSMRFTPRS